MTKGKIVFVPFPFDDLSSTKVRPAVCLTNPIGPIVTWSSPSSPVASRKIRKRGPDIAYH